VNYEEIRKRFEAYEHFDPENGFTVFSPEKRKRAFKWNTDNHFDDVVDLFAGDFGFYYQELAFPTELRKNVEAKYEIVERIIDAVDDALAYLGKFLKEAGNKQRQPLNTMVAQISPLRTLMKREAIQYLESKDRVSLLKKGLLSEPGPDKTANKRIVLRLDYTLQFTTNLTRGNRAEHIMALMAHFDINCDLNREAVIKAISEERSHSEWDNIYSEMDNRTGPPGAYSDVSIMEQLGPRPP
jgi:hypothetical protein